MKISYKLLKEWIGFSESPDQIAEIINLHITEVERITSSSQYQGVVVGEILEIGPHPDADKLQLTKVNVGDQTLDIVCGANNIAVGQKVPVALVGCVLPNGLEIRTAAIRGVRSHGMLCSKAELNLEQEPEGIWILDDSFKVGTPLSEVIGEDNDTVFDLKVLANRPDYLSYLSIGREIAAVLKKDFNPDIKYDFVEASDKTADNATVEVKDTSLCPRYIGRVIKDVTVKPSPTWVQKVLLASGLRPINNIVDISNYVLLELGQPTHAFDLNKVADCRIVVRLAKTGESLRALDGNEYELGGQTLVIADAKRPLAIAGVVGGEDGSVSEQTKDLLLEVANFNMTSIRQTSRRLGVRTESSARFERGLSVLLPELAMRRLVHLIQQNCPNCQVLEGMVDVHGQLPPPAIELEIDSDRVNQLAGIKIEPQAMADILTRLDMSAKHSDHHLIVKVPNYRLDVSGTADITEEVLRIHGVDQVPLMMPEVVTSPPQVELMRGVVRRVKEIMARLGFIEVYLSPFDQGSLKAVKLDNPLVSNLTHLKTDLVPGLAAAEFVSGGEQADAFKVFEANTIFVDEGGVLPSESTQLVGRIKSTDAYRRIRGVADVLLDSLGVSIDYREVQGLMGLRILMNKKQVGEVVQSGLNDAYLSLDLSALMDEITPIKLLYPLPKFPPVKFDMAFVVPHRARIGDVLKDIESADILIRKAELFDVHDLGKTGKNVAFHIEIRSETKTLTSEDRKQVEGRIKNALQERHKARLRET